MSLLLVSLEGMSILSETVESSTTTGDATTRQLSISQQSTSRSRKLQNLRLGRTRREGMEEPVNQMPNSYVYHNKIR